MATTFMNVSRCCNQVKRGRYFRTLFNAVRLFAVATNVDLDQKVTAKNKNLLEAYHKKRIIDEKTLNDLGPKQFKDLKEILEEERKKVILRYTETEIKQDVWTEKSRRTGAIGMKIGMSLLWRKDGRPVRVTLLQVQRNAIVDHSLGQT